MFYCLLTCIIPKNKTNVFLILIPPYKKCSFFLPVFNILSLILSNYVPSCSFFMLLVAWVPLNFLNVYLQFSSKLENFYTIISSKPFLSPCVLLKFSHGLFLFLFVCTFYWGIGVGRILFSVSFWTISTAMPSSSLIFSSMMCNLPLLTSSVFF